MFENDFSLYRDLKQKLKLKEDISENSLKMSLRNLYGRKSNIKKELSFESGILN